MFDLCEIEIDQVNGAVTPYTYTAPNGITYANIVKVTRHYWEDVDGSREYFVDAAATGGIPPWMQELGASGFFSQLGIVYLP